MPYRGAFHGIKEVTARNNKKYHAAAIGDSEMSIWDPDVAAALQNLPIGVAQGLAHSSGSLHHNSTILPGSNTNARALPSR